MAEKFGRDTFFKGLIAGVGGAFLGYGAEDKRNSLASGNHRETMHKEALAHAQILLYHMLDARKEALSQGITFSGYFKGVGSMIELTRTMWQPGVEDTTAFTLRESQIISPVLSDVIKQGAGVLVQEIVTACPYLLVEPVLSPTTQVKEGVFDLKNEVNKHYPDNAQADIAKEDLLQWMKERERHEFRWQEKVSLPVSSTSAPRKA